MNCGKCHGSFEKEGRDPLLLPSCGHTLCRSCLRLFIQHNGFKCPFCGKKQPPKLNLSDILPNYALLQMMEDETDDTGKGSKKDRHRSRGRAARNNKNNDKTREESKHRIIENECVEHEGVRLTYWCGPCGVAVCGECVVEKHTGGGSGGGRKHHTVRIDTALKDKRSELEQLVLMVMQTLEVTEKKHSSLAKHSPFVAAARKVQDEVTAVMGKMRIVLSLLSCLIQEGEDGDAGIKQLREQMDELLQKAPPSGSPATGNVAEIMAMLKHLKCMEEFRDGPVAKVIKEVDASGKEDRQTLLTIASLHTAALNVKAASLCKQVVCCGDGCYLEVVGGGGLLGSLTWDQNKLHLHCLRRPSSSEPRRPFSDPARRHALKWQVLQTQMQEMRQVFLELAWGGPGQGAPGKERVYFKLCSSTAQSSCRRFLHFMMGDENSDGSTSLIRPLVWETLDVVGRAILLGTQTQKEAEGIEKTKEAATEDTNTSHTQANSSNQSLFTFAVGNVICIKGRSGEGVEEFWLVMDETTLTTKLPGTYEVVATLLPSHKNLFAKLPSVGGMKVQDCGAVLFIEKPTKESAHASPAAPSARVSPSVYTKNAQGGIGAHKSNLLIHLPAIVSASEF